MKTAEKLAAGWLLTLGFMFLTLSVSAGIEKHNMLKPIPSAIEEDDGPNFVNKEALYLLDTTARQGLIFGVPTLILGGWLSLGLYRQSRQEKKAINQQMNDRLQSIFYQMLQENRGRMTLVGFAIKSDLPAIAARQYLDEKAKEFNANFKVTEDGGISYHFEI
ncbi:MULTISPECIES: hypothetical protein [unclassified Tolypothrix]|uniref:hypothetical protein n=1 Tax=unclassified Tolypothrix TaxID=2649714 RepID=UPI0005EAAA60|nr:MULTISPECIES: hypothetical protein [unclassified Tolypothrix]BAY94299.1 hypothetical protein NIES3275_63450 [Microchaete diplosiphon NIES-3275]EKF03949.1 hypothetical protein FDUTEX481_02952 [Tolypothrix sp. PCC 7601]MBE9086049.1 hypothetical protein [Tolypothrix sp. LEGE 11397]UYD28033.1 hypothetical protein HGR01_08305 [Tolypothrix sp. PCC 7712]UYD36096.1 hypothetical protein HG267_10320 [Tolypothrix sp. PCC 7601]